MPTVCSGRARAATKQSAAAASALKRSVLVPVYNERATLAETVRRVLAVDLGAIEKEITIVDDGSTDGTREIIGGLAARHPEITVVLQPQNMGRERPSPRR